MRAGRETSRFGDFELDPARCELRRAGRVVELEPTPFRVLQHLLRERERVVSKEELLEAVWPGVVVSDAALASALKEVRRALGDDGKSQSWIRTLRGRGVRFVGEVTATGVRDGVRSLGRGRLAPRAEGSVATVLFADLVDSTARVQALGDERARAIFETLHASMSSLLEAHGGHELQWLGDGLMASFGSCADAVRCAVALQRHMHARPSPQRLGLRIGLNVGEMISRQGDSGYFGTPVVIASRLCDRAEAGQIVASGVVAGLLAGRRAFRFRDLGSLELKGIDAPVPACEVAYDAGTAAPLTGGTPFVGRSEELDGLAALLERVVAGQGGVLFVTGEAGIGKTRLLEEFAARARERGARVLWGGCYEGEGRSAFGPFAEALDAYVADADRRELAADLGPYGAELAHLAPRLRERLPDLSPLPHLAGHAERERLFYAFVALLQASARRAPLVVVLDDLHWADAGTCALLRHVGRAARKSPLLVLGSYRDAELTQAQPLAEALVALRREAEHERLALAGLEPGEVAALLEALAQHEVEHAFAEQLAAATGGNPFFVREFLLHLLEQGTLRREEGRWTVTLPRDTLGVPEGVRQVLGRRLARLPPDAASLLGAAAGFHAAFSFEVARRVAGLAESEALDALDDALDAQLVRPTCGADRYEFGHDLIRQTLYTGLNPSRQARLHRGIAEEMERAFGEDAGERSGEIAWQYHRSRELPGAAPRGVVHCLAAAEQAQRAAAQEHAAEALRMALDLLPPGDPRRPRVLARRALALAWSLAAEEAFRAGSEAAELLAASEGDEAAASFLVDLTQASYLHARELSWALAEQGLRYVGKRRNRAWALFASDAQNARDAADPAFPGVPLDLPIRREITDVIVRDEAGSGDPALRREGLVFRSRAEALAYGHPVALFSIAGELRSALPAYEAQSGQALARGELSRAVYWLALTSRIHTALGELRAASERIEQASGIAAGLTEASVAYLNLAAARADLASVRGEGFEPLLAIGDALVARAAPEQAFGRANLIAYVACGQARVGNDARAREALALTLPGIARAPGWASNYTGLVHKAAEAIWLLDWREHAPLVEANLREKTLAPDFRYPSTDARLSLARLCTVQGRCDEALTWFDAARAVLDEQEAGPLRAITDHDEAQVRLRRGAAGDREHAVVLLETALAAFLDIGMPGWEKLGRELLRTARA